MSNPINYDAIGNPTSYNGWTYTWEAGRQLASASKTGTSMSFKYDDSGYRTQKTVNGVATNYYLEGDKVIFEKTGTQDAIYYTYDENNKLISMNQNGTEYYYIRNVQDDIIGLIDNSGTQVVSYTYDSWGKLISTTGSLASTVGASNPFRYRGYRYDTETGLYLLSSRYYDPVIGRFLNADVPETMILQGNSSILATNLFAYCFNNPVNYSDHSGMFVTPANVIGALIGAIGGYFVGNSIANYFGLKGWARWACTAGTSLLLGVVGWFSGPAIYAAIKAAIIWSISAGTLLINKVADWIRPILGIVDSNKLSHIFGNTGHKLSGFLNSFGGNQGRAFYAVQNALGKLKLGNGVFNRIAVKVNGYTIYVNGIVENGVKKIGTFFIK